MHEAMMGTLLIVALIVLAIWWLFKRPLTHQDMEYTDIQDAGGRFDIEVVGESHYLINLRKIAGRGEVRHECTAELVMEPNNRHDSNAVRVDIQGLTVGYLNRVNAAQYRLQVSHVAKNLVGRVPALIIGGGHGRTNLGVWLDLPGAR